MSNENEGHGGSYEIGPDGVRRLMDRTKGVDHPEHPQNQPPKPAPSETDKPKKGK